MFSPPLFHNFVLLYGLCSVVESHLLRCFFRTEKSSHFGLKMLYFSIFRWTEYLSVRSADDATRFCSLFSSIFWMSAQQRSPGTCPDFRQRIVSTVSSAASFAVHGSAQPPAASRQSFRVECCRCVRRALIAAQKKLKVIAVDRAEARPRAALVQRRRHRPAAVSSLSPYVHSSRRPVHQNQGSDFRACSSWEPGIYFSYRFPLPGASF
jgi:hypothetical protein